MPKINITARNGVETVVEGDIGFSVMEIIRGRGFDELVALCGGCCSCATCHVYVDSAFAKTLPPMNDDEDALLDSSNHRRPESRLSCQIRFSDGLSNIKVRIAPED